MKRHVPGLLPRAGQHGQVLVPGLLLLGGLAAVLVMSYGVGRTVESRTRLIHAADAAAFSGALEQARQLNFLAYANRAQVAHQIAMAHLVTLGASMAFADTLAGQHRRNNPPEHLLATLFGREVAQSYRVARADPQVLADLARAYAEHDRVVHDVLAAGSAAVVAGLPAARARLVRAALRDNLGGGESPVFRLSHDDWPGYVRRRAATRGSGLWLAVELAAARYAFLGRRDATRSKALPGGMRCPQAPHALRRRGSTWLGSDGRWGAIDTQSFHSSRQNRWAGCYYREYSMGWGAVLAPDAKAPPGVEYVASAPTAFTAQDFWHWVRQSTTWDLRAGTGTPLANSYAMAGARRWPGRGLPDDYEVAKDAVPLRFTLTVRQERQVAMRARAGDERAMSSARLDGPMAITVSSSAETYFSQPSAHSGGGDGLAPLFRPYWLARLAPGAPARQPQGGGAP